MVLYNVHFLVFLCVTAKVDDIFLYIYTIISCPRVHQGICSTL